MTLISLLLRKELSTLVIAVAVFLAFAAAIVWHEGKITELREEVRAEYILELQQKDKDRATEILSRVGPIGVPLGVRREGIDPDPRGYRD